jgi:DNA invertase Pin-like site-specific DNA recombinase
MKAVIYARVSTTEQNPERQILDIKQYASYNDIEIVKEFPDYITGISKQEDRPKFAEMMDYIEANNIKLIIIYEISRLGRSLTNALNIIETLKAKGINIYFRKENVFSMSEDAAQLLNLEVLASLAGYQRKLIKTNTMQGTAISINNGGSGGGVYKQYGYKNVNSKLVIDEKEKAVILEIIDLYLNKNYGLIAIANYLNKEGVKTRINKLIEETKFTKRNTSKLIWSASMVNKILHAKLLTGFRKYGEIEQQFEHLRIISNDTFEALQIKMNSKRKSLANAQKYENVLKGIVYCGFCGGALIMEKGEQASNHYKCYNKFRRKENCTEARMINIDLLNNTVYHLTKNFKVDSINILNKIAINKNLLIQNDNKMLSIDLEIKELKKRIERAYERYELGNGLLETFITREAELNSKIAEQETKREQILISNNKLNTEINHYNNTKSVDLTQPLIFKEHIKLLVERIKVSEIDKKKVETMATTNGLKIVSSIGVKFDNGKLSEHNRVNFNVADKRNILYHIGIKMIDGTKYSLNVNSMQNDISKIITVDKVNSNKKRKQLQ